MSRVGRMAVQLEPFSRSGDFLLPSLILKKVVFSILIWCIGRPVITQGPPMARMLVFDGDECLWNGFVEALESEDYTVCKACNDDEGLPHPYTEIIALRCARSSMSAPADWRVHRQGQQAMCWRSPTSLACRSVRTGWRDTRR
jgi:hypothetical protein